jgi:hypothetical protein
MNAQVAGVIRVSVPFMVHNPSPQESLTAKAEEASWMQVSE